MRRILSGVLAAVALAPCAHADEWVVEAAYPNREALQSVAKHFEHVIVDKKRQVLRVETNEAGIAAIEAAGLGVTIDEASTAKLREFNDKLGAAASRGVGLDGIPGYECFRTVEETYQTMDDLASAHPDIAKVDDIGPSWQKTEDDTQGYEMRAMHITNLATAADDPDRPTMAAYFSIHAREYTPAEIGTRFAEWLVNNYGVDPEATWLVDHNDFRLILLANPDARKEAEQQIYHRKNMDDTYGGINQCGDDEFSQFGVDLNRNFPFHWNITLGQGSDDDACSQTFHGPYADGSNHDQHIQGPVEPETHNLFSYVAGTCDADGNCTGGLFHDRRQGSLDPPDCIGPADCDDGNAAPDDTSGFFLDMHSNAALVLWPWGDTSTDSPNVDALTTFGRRLAYFNGYTPQQSNELYFTDGSTDDSMYGLLGVASYTIETNGFDFFEDCDSFEQNTAPTNLATLRYAARALHAPYKLPAGPDTIDVQVSSNLVAPEESITVTAHLDSSRFNQSNGTSPVHPIAAASMYENVLPWDTDAIEVMNAADGAFDSAVETATLTIEVPHVSGRNFVYVQGSDDAGNVGTPNAAFYDVAELADIGTLVGRVKDATTNLGLGASIVLTDPDSGETHTALSDPATGEYVAHAYPGSYDIVASAPRHMSATLDLDFTAGSSFGHDFLLLPDCVVFADDMENGGDAWTAQTPWVIASGTDADTTQVWTTPDYGDDLSRSVTTASSFDLTGYSDVTLDFDDRCATESGYDYGYAEYSTNGSTWNTVYQCTGQTAWQSHHIVLPADANGGASLKIRFRLGSDDFQNAPGFSVDNVRLAAGGTACIAQQSPPDGIFENGFEP